MKPLALMHMGIVLLHGAAHAALAVYAPPLATLYIVTVIYAAPVVALVMLWRHRLRGGALLLALSLAGSFLFGTYHHFLAVSNDHVCHLPPGAWRPVFQLTAGLSSFVDGVGALVAAGVARRAS